MEQIFRQLISMVMKKLRLTAKPQTLRAKSRRTPALFACSPKTQRTSLNSKSSDLSELKPQIQQVPVSQESKRSV